MTADQDDEEQRNKRRGVIESIVSCHPVENNMSVEVMTYTNNNNHKQQQEQHPVCNRNETNSEGQQPQPQPHETNRRTSIIIMIIIISIAISCQSKDHVSRLSQSKYRTRQHLVAILFGVVTYIPEKKPGPPWHGNGMACTGRSNIVVVVVVVSDFGVGRQMVVRTVHGQCCVSLPP